jgi:hypothetical protein
VEHLLAIYDEVLSDKNVSAAAPLSGNRKTGPVPALDIVRSLLFAYSLRLPPSARTALKHPPGVGELLKRLQRQ